MADFFEDKHCFCAFIEYIGPIRDELLGFIDALIAALEVAKATYQLLNPFDLAELAQLEVDKLGLAVLEAAVQPVEQFFNVFASYTAPFADCDPLSTLSGATLQLRDQILEPIDEYRWKIQSKEVEFGKRNKVLDKLDSLIQLLTDFKTLINQCGD